MRLLQSLAIVLAGWCSVGHAMDFLITVPHSSSPSAPATAPTWGIGASYGTTSSYIMYGSYITNFNVTDNTGSSEIYVNILAATATTNPSNPTVISYEIKNTSTNNIITYGTFNEPQMSNYTSITAHSSGNLTAGWYSIKLFMSGAIQGENVFSLATPRFSPAIVTPITQVPEPSTIIMSIICIGVLIGVKALC